ncbi:MAG TPA: oligopeptide:H+ symporter [Steroidobacteraceae bacterium]|nr:oligopeptide:H+ symporter [Steroidobacteraceae bacterium]
MTPRKNAPDLWGHPRQLWMLLGVTVGLNFAFYGFRAFLAPYIAQTFFAGLAAGESMRHADRLVSGIGALLYATPIIGGYVADNILGEVRALLAALWLGALATALMVWPGLLCFELAMALYVLSAGLSIPLTVLIGRNYPGDDPRRDAGYTLFYLAINFGAFVAPFICAAWIGHRYGYRYGFLAASAGMALAALLLQRRGSRLHAVVPSGPHLRRRGAMIKVLLVMLVALYPTALLLGHPHVLDVMMYALMGLLVTYFVASGVRRRDRVQAQRYAAMLLLFAANIAFWALSLQGVSSLNFFARDYVSAPFDFTLFQSFNPLYILVLAPLLALLWPWLDARRINPSTPRKFGIGLLLVALSYGVTAYGIHHWTGAGGRVGWWLLALCYLLQTVGELALSPIGYAMVTRLAAPEEASLAMGGWFFGVAIAYDLAGQIAALTTTSAIPGIAGYAHVYDTLFLMGLAAAAVYLLAAPWIARLMHGAR